MCLSPRWMNSAEGITLPCNDRSEMRSVQVNSRVKNQGGVMQDLLLLTESNAGDSLFGISDNVYQGCSLKQNIA